MYPVASGSDYGLRLYPRFSKFSHLHMNITSNVVSILYVKFILSNKTIVGWTVYLQNQKYVFTKYI